MNEPLSSMNQKRVHITIRTELQADSKQPIQGLLRRISNMNPQGSKSGSPGLSPEAAEGRHPRFFPGEGSTPIGLPKPKFRLITWDKTFLGWLAEGVSVSESSSCLRTASPSAGPSNKKGGGG
jgi:hypothetical protein